METTKMMKKETEKKRKLEESRIITSKQKKASRKNKINNTQNRKLDGTQQKSGGEGKNPNNEKEKAEIVTHQRRNNYFWVKLKVGNKKEVWIPTWEGWLQHPDAMTDYRNKNKKREVLG